MADIVDKKTRSRMMSGIRGKNTRPELLIRRKLHSLGFRYRIHDKRFPGKPDILLPKYHAAIFVHGCFWHGHDCHLFKQPTSNIIFWKKKIERNRQLDIKNRELFKISGWRLLIVWECSLKGKKRLLLDDVIQRISDWIKSDNLECEIRGYETSDTKNDDGR
ncbi:very short patch repair endonuclease [Geothermobacter hydrogeniphilus]|uniref:Very short patch repair endonuclease n=1 Tax=Geothermobacter hydrogeniphilus TaxID=1969733 RepID=A0A1X0Y8W0_9BACT|nr:very short patch repair endonuclease [Geothermobacter hydrogeniphilus]ORJ61615.1 very short patch repair endonuclease [Geothermobacter hydrogeniphilus]